MHTVLEIGSGSYKLCKAGVFSEKFESSLGKNLENFHLNSDSVKIALNNLDTKILPFLKAESVNPADVLVFATAALRLSMNDPKKSGEIFIQELLKRGFKSVRVFSEEDECLYGAKAVINEVEASIKNLRDFSILDTGGASHQLISVRNLKIENYKSFPIGSHTAFRETDLPDLSSYGFTASDTLIVLGTTGQILSSAKNLLKSKNIYADIKSLNARLEVASINERKIVLEYIIAEPKIRSLFLDYRLAIIPKAIKIILNVISQLNCKQIMNVSQESIQFISKEGFSNNFDKQNSSLV